MQTIPVPAVPTPNISTVVAGQNCQIFLYQKKQGLFFDLNVNGVDIVTGVLVHDCDPLVCIQYSGFQGNFIFVDTQGSDDPQSTGFGTRWFLVYLTATENSLLGTQ